MPLCLGLWAVVVSAQSLEIRRRLYCFGRLLCERAIRRVEQSALVLRARYQWW